MWMATPQTPIRIQDIMNGADVPTIRSKEFYDDSAHASELRVPGCRLICYNLREYAGIAFGLHLI